MKNMLFITLQKMPYRMYTVCESITGMVYVMFFAHVSTKGFKYSVNVFFFLNQHVQYSVLNFVHASIDHFGIFFSSFWNNQLVEAGSSLLSTIPSLSPPPVWIWCIDFQVGTQEQFVGPCFKEFFILQFALAAWKRD